MILNELKALANEKRLKVIYSLLKNDFCQIHIIEISGLSQVDASRSLKALVEAELVDSRKIGNRVIYSLSSKLKEEYANQLQVIEKEYNYLLSEIDLDKTILDCKLLDEV